MLPLQKLKSKFSSESEILILKILKRRKEPICAYYDEDKNWHPNQACVIHCFEKRQNVGCTSAECTCEGTARSPHFGDRRPESPSRSESPSRG